MDKIAPTLLYYSIFKMGATGHSSFFHVGQNIIATLQLSQIFAKFVTDQDKKQWLYYIMV